MRRRLHVALDSMHAKWKPRATTNMISRYLFWKAKRHMPRPQPCGDFCISKVDNTARSREKKLAKTNFPFYTDFRIQTPFFPIFGSFSLFAVIWCIRCIGFSWMSGFIINIGAPKTLYTNIVASLRGDERCEHCRSNYTLGSDNGNGNGNSKGSEKLYRYLITRVCIHFGIIFHWVISIERLFQPNDMIATPLHRSAQQKNHLQAVSVCVCAVQNAVTLLDYEQNKWKRDIRINIYKWRNKEIEVEKKQHEKEKNRNSLPAKWANRERGAPYHIMNK